MLKPSRGELPASAGSLVALLDCKTTGQEGEYMPRGAACIVASSTAHYHLPEVWMLSQLGGAKLLTGRAFEARPHACSSLGGPP